MTYLKANNITRKKKKDKQRETFKKMGKYTSKHLRHQQQVIENRNITSNSKINDKKKK